MTCYTLAEAKLELARKECEQYGHDYEVVVLIGQNAPRHVLCRRCGRSWGIQEAVAA
jgi:hypothetical protein